MSIRVVSLWGAKRDPVKESSLPTPSNIDKGVRELVKLGYAIDPVHPLEVRRKSRSPLAKALGKRLLILFAVPDLLRKAKGGDVVTYTSDIRWAFYCGILKKLGLLKAPTITYWAGFDVDMEALKRPSRARRYYDIALSGSDICRVISQHELELWAQVYPEHAHRLRFHPTAVDMDYYQPHASDTWSAAGELVVIGDDAMRDWDLPLALAARGRRITILSSSARAQALVADLKPEDAQRVRLIPKAGFAKSAEIAAEASCLLLSTRPNNRFSGATTVGVAVGLKRPMVIDEPYDLAAYGLTPGQNCEAYARGDVDSAMAAIDRVLTDTAHAERLRVEIGRLTEALSITLWGDVLAGYIGELIKPAASGPAVGPALVSAAARSERALESQSSDA